MGGYVVKKVEDDNKKTTLYECTTCGGKISKNAKVCPHCGEDGGASIYETKQSLKEADKLVKEYARSGSKSRVTSFILTALFGNFGLFYARFMAGLGLLVVNIIIIFMIFSSSSAGESPRGLILVLIFTWYILPILWGDSIISKQKRKLLAEAKLMSR